MRLAVILLAAATAAAHAQPAPAADDALARARALEAQLAYDEALAVVDAEIRAGRADRDRLAELYLLAGKLAAGLDRAADAEAHFAIALALRPSSTLPAGTSPKLTAPFAAARARAVPLDVRVAVTAAHVTVEPVADPLGVVAGIGVRFQRRGSLHADSARELTHTRFVRTPDMRIIEVHALDRHGNVLAVLAPPPDPVAVPVHDEPSFVGRWSTWAALTGVALATGGVAAWRFRVAQDEFDDRRTTATFTELQDIEARGDRWGLTANISFGVAAATAITSAILFARRPATEPGVAVLAGPGAVLGLAGRF